MTTTHSALLTPTGEPVGAIVNDLDATRALSPEVILALKQGLLDHHILIFKNQDLSEPQFKDFAAYFGSVFLPPADVPVLASKDGGATPEIVLSRTSRAATPAMASCRPTRITTGRLTRRAALCCTPWKFPIWAATRHFTTCISPTRP